MKMKSVVSVVRFVIVNAATLLTITKQVVLLSGCVELVTSCDSSDRGPRRQHHHGHDDHQESTDRQLLGAAQGTGALVVTSAEECGFIMPSDGEIAEDTAKMIEWQRIENMTPPWVRSNRTYTIPTYVHVIQTSTSTGIITDSRIQDMIDYLNNAFTNSTAPFVFENRQITRTVRSDWTKCNDRTTETQVKTLLKVGNGDTLNVYICPPMINDDGIALAGFAYYPSSTIWTSILDGVVINNDNTERRFNTLVHEVGHFLGLIHTFGDNTTCNANSLGDRVDDTPQHISYPSIVNCNSDPSKWDTCPNLPGIDPVDNYMTYSNNNLCRTRFTAGQTTRMVAQYELYRRQAPTSPPVMAPIPRPIPAPIPLPFPVPIPQPIPAPFPRPIPVPITRPIPVQVTPPSQSPTTSTRCFFAKCSTETKCCAGFTCRLNRGLLRIVIGSRCLPF